MALVNMVNLSGEKRQKTFGIFILQTCCTYKSDFVIEAHLNLLCFVYQPAKFFRLYFLQSADE